MIERAKSRLRKGDIAIMRLSCGILLGLVGLASCITVDDFYPFNPQHDQRLPNGDSTSSHKIALSVPAKFYDTEYDYLWVSLLVFSLFFSRNWQ